MELSFIRALRFKRFSERFPREFIRKEGIFPSFLMSYNVSYVAYLEFPVELREISGIFTSDFHGRLNHGSIGNRI